MIVARGPHLDPGPAAVCSVHTKDEKQASPLQPRNKAGRDKQGNGDKDKAAVKYKAFAALYICD